VRGQDRGQREGVGRAVVVEVEVDQDRVRLGALRRAGQARREPGELVAQRDADGLGCDAEV
jgi:hypothetical protein